MLVTFTQHAIDRMQQRLSISVPTNTKVNIAPLFTKSHTYVNTQTGRLVSAFCSKDTSKKVVLIVDVQKSAVVTVYLGTNITGLSAPFVDKCYAMLR